MQYKIIDVIDPLSALHENNSIMFEPLADETLNLHRVKIVQATPVSHLPTGMFRNHLTSTIKISQPGQLKHFLTARK